MKMNTGQLQYLRSWLNTTNNSEQNKSNTKQYVVYYFICIK